LKYATLEKATQSTVEGAWARAREVWKQMNSKDLFLLLKAVKDKGELLDFESEKLLNRMLLRYTQSGHGSLDETDIKRRLET
jgi:metallopeptidase MepB